HDKRSAANARDRNYVPEKIIIDLVVDRGVDRVRRSDPEERMAVCRRSDHDFGRDRTGRSRPVLDEERLTEALRQPLTQRTRDDVAVVPAGKPMITRTGRVG